MSEVTICNLALSHLGDTATVASIKPPDSSIQAQLCARFYPVARDALLEMSSWGFATRRVALALIQEIVDGSSPAVYPDNTPATWRFMYAMPSGVINLLAVLPADTPDDYEAWFGPIENDFFPSYPQGYMPVPGAPLIATQPYAVETRAVDGSEVILTNVCEAVLRYTVAVTDTTKFSPLFVLALSHLLASMLAGPILKGDAGIAASEQQLQIFNAMKGQAATSDANQRKTHVEPAVSWIRGR